MINTIALLTTSAFSLGLLAMVFFRMRSVGHEINDRNPWFNTLIATNAVMLCFDAAMQVLDGQPSQLAQAALPLVTVGYYIGQPLAAICWFFYAWSFVMGSKRRSLAFLLPYLAPAALNIALTLISLKGGYFFSFDADNWYHRGPYFGLAAAIGYGYLLSSFVLIFLNRRRVDKRTLNALLVYALMPSVGGLVQSFYYGLNLIWPAMSLGILFIYLSVQNELLLSDYLTGIHNRRSLDGYLARLSQGEGQGRLGAFMIDLDDFKSINDKYGHEEGDRALVAAAAALRQCFHHRDFIARYGGDEFVVIAPIRSESDMEGMKERLASILAAWNQSSGKPWRIDFSVGSFACDQERLVPEDLLRRIDRTMYESKLRRKSCR